MTDLLAPASCTSTAALKERYGERFRWLFLLSVLVATVASIISSTIVNVAIPSMSTYFQVGQERAQWVTSSFMVATTIAMLTTPWLLSRYGYRRTYVSSVLLLLFGGVLGGLANDFNIVLLARAIEGIAAGIIQPIPAVIILYAFAPHEQGRASGLFGLGVVLAPALGPSLGGVLVDLMGWRSIFFMVVPPCLASLWLALRYVPTSAPGGDTHAGSERLDWGGLALVTTGTLCLLNGLVQLHGNSLATALGLLAAAALSCAGFVAWQHYLIARGQQPLMDLRLFSVRPFVMGSIVAFIYGTAMFGSTYLLPVFMQVGLHMSASYAGTVLVPAGIALAITIPLVGRLADKQPTHWLVSLGVGTLALSFALMLWVNTSTAMWVLVLFTIISRIGLGFILPSLNLGAMRPLERSLITQGSSTISFIRMLGGAAGVSLCGIVLEWRLSIAQSSQDLAQEAANMQAFHETFAMLTGLCLLALVAALQLRPPVAANAREESSTSP
jgi:EmrB/QacA subfamily drug resistance transporter